MTTISRARITLAGALIIGIGAVGAWFALAPSAGSAGEAGLAVSLGDGAIGLEHAVAASGRTVVEVVNEGSGEHELVAVRTDSAPADLPVGLSGVSVAAAGDLLLGEDHVATGHEHEPGTVLGLLPGESSAHQVALAPGHYVFFCQTPGHYEAGEYAGLTVERTPPGT